MNRLHKYWRDDLRVVLPAEWVRSNRRVRTGRDSARPSKCVLLLLLLACCGSTLADEDILLQRIVALETRVAELEEKLAPVLEEERVKRIVVQQKNRAHERALLDAEFLSRLDLNLVEKAYHTANQNWKSDEAKNAVVFLVEKFPQANRTGCAVLSRAQSTEGDEQLALLKQAIEHHGNCYFLNGVQVGPYARLYLGMRHTKEEKTDEAAEQFEILRTTHPNAIDHKGQLLTTHLGGLE